MPTSRRSTGPVRVQKRQRPLHHLVGVGDAAGVPLPVVLHQVVERVRDAVPALDDFQPIARHIPSPSASQGRKPSRNRSVAGMKYEPKCDIGSRVATTSVPGVLVLST